MMQNTATRCGRCARGMQGAGLTKGCRVGAKSHGMQLLQRRLQRKSTTKKKSAEVGDAAAAVSEDLADRAYAAQRALRALPRQIQKKAPLPLFRGGAGGLNCLVPKK